jgi:hypothetical protein
MMIRFQNCFRKSSLRERLRARARESSRRSIAQPLKDLVEMLNWLVVALAGQVAVLQWK